MHNLGISVEPLHTIIFRNEVLVFLAYLIYKKPQYLLVNKHALRNTWAKLGNYYKVLIVWICHEIRLTFFATCLDCCSSAVLFAFTHNDQFLVTIENRESIVYCHQLWETRTTERTRYGLILSLLNKDVLQVFFYNWWVELWNYHKLLNPCWWLLV